jgi:xanthine/uracil permease
MLEESIVFIAVCAISLALSPKQGAIPKFGYELFVTLVGRSKQYRYHIHHWMYMLIIVLVAVVSRHESNRTYNIMIAALCGAVTSEFLKYTDVLTIRV